MAKTTVRLEMEVQDLQIINLALGLLHHVGINKSRAQRDADPLEEYVLDCTLGDGDPRKLALKAEGLRREIGIKDSPRRHKVKTL